MSVFVSSDEQLYIVSGCENNVRNDGRGCDDYRFISLDCSLFPHVNGSSRVKIGDSVDVICSIKVDVVEPLEDYPDRGRIDVNVEISPVCSLTTAHNIGSNNTSSTSESQENLEMQLSHLIEQSLVGWKAFPWSQLSIIPGKYCWIIYIDLLVLQMDGDITTACSLATFLGLNQMKIPQTYPKIHDEFEIDGDLTTASSLTTIFQHAPILIPVYQLGRALVIDPCQEEMDCSVSIMVFAITAQEMFTTIHLHQMQQQITLPDGSGSTASMMTRYQPINMQYFLIALQKASDAAKNIFNNLQVFLQEQERKEAIEEFPYNPKFSLGLLEI